VVWNFYSLQTAATAADAFNDYPKFGIWPDGLYMSSNMFAISGGAFTNAPRVGVSTRPQMYAGASTIQIQSFDAPAGEFTLLPSNARLQAGTPAYRELQNYFTSVFQLYQRGDHLQVHADWNNAFNSTFSRDPLSRLRLRPWGQRSRQCVHACARQLKSTHWPLASWCRNQYTNIGGVESLWDSHTVLGKHRNPRLGQRPAFYQVGS